LESASVQFVLFGLGVALLSNLFSTPAWRSAVLLLASAAFVVMLAHGAVSLIPLLSFLVIGYGGLMILCSGRRRLLPAILLLTIVAYVWLKKYTILPGQLFLSFPYLTLGLSYIFFRVLHLQIESRDSSEQEPIPITKYLLYTLNFTTLVSGPIQRYEDFSRDQFGLEPVEINAGVIATQIERIVRGVFKVNVLGVILLAWVQDALIRLSSSSLASPSSKFLAGMTAIAAYPLFLYANFSGYIDIVIALARLMRLRLPENFDRPFSACSFIDFWNRWHITLSTWLKSYVYNPLILSLMRRSRSVSMEPYIGAFCFFVTFFLVGLWHGRTSEFFLFGLLQGGGVAVNKLWQVWLGKRLGRKRYKALASQSAYKTFARGLTFTWFAFTLIWFRAGWPEINDFFASLSPLRWLLCCILLWVCASAVLEAWEQIRTWLLTFWLEGYPVVNSRYVRVVQVTAEGLLAVLFLFLLNEPAPGIVYKAF
jgi:D-alanyl-lipoteichoic acid acyltransferase DltB (MBOAT superfamily)